MERTAAPSPLLEEPDRRRANLQICYSCLVEYQSPALLTGSVGVVEENMDEMGRMTKASSSDSEMESRTAPNCVNCLGRGLNVSELFQGGHFLFATC